MLAIVVMRPERLPKSVPLGSSHIVGRDAEGDVIDTPRVLYESFVSPISDKYGWFPIYIFSLYVPGAI